MRLRLIVKLLLIFPQIPFSLEDCPLGYYGDDCNRKCHCLLHTFPCNQETGACTDGDCARGWRGAPICQEECPVNAFGLNCGETCRCPNRDTCNPVNGLCRSGVCLAGWSGASCQKRLPVLAKPPLIRRVSDSSVTLQWRAWSRNVDIGEPPIGAYKVSFQQSGHRSWMNGLTMVHTDRPFYVVKVPHLENGAEYRFRVTIYQSTDGKLSASVPGPATEYVLIPKTASYFISPVTPSVATLTNPGNQGVTSGEMSGVPGKLRLSHRTNTSLTVTWSRVLHSMSSHIKLSCTTVKPPSKSKHIHSVSFILPPKSTNFSVQKLLPRTRYRVELFMLSHPDRPIASGLFWTSLNAPPRPRPPLIVSVSVTRVQIEFLPVSNHTGTLWAYRIVVIPWNNFKVNSSELNRHRPDTGMSSENRVDGFFNMTGYVTAQLRASDYATAGVYNFTTGDNQTYDGFHNRPLYPGTAYSFAVVAVARHDREEKTSVSRQSELVHTQVRKPVSVETHSVSHQNDTSSGGSVSAGGIIVIILLVLLFVVGVPLLVVYRHKLKRCEDWFRGLELRSTLRNPRSWYAEMSSRNQAPLDATLTPKRNGTAVMGGSTDSLLTMKGTPDHEVNNAVITNSNMIRVDELATHFSGYSDVSIADEFALLPRSIQFKMPSMSHGTDARNVRKNRAPTKIPFDKNRVVLKNGDSDYINASYVHGYPRVKHYIVTQTPLLSTTADFWEVVYDNDISTIVMLHSCGEVTDIPHGSYWPENEPQAYNDVTVQITNHYRRSNYTVRAFAVSKTGAESIKMVNHYQYRSWLKTDLPKSSSEFVEFVCMVQEESRKQKSSVLVHCPYGAGRCGMYVAVDSLLTQAKMRGSVDVFRLVSRFLGERVHFIESQEQYSFIYECLVVKMCSQTDVKKLVKRSPVKTVSSETEVTDEAQIHLVDIEEDGEVTHSRRTIRRKLYADVPETALLEPAWCSDLQELPKTSFLSIGGDFYIMTSPPEEARFTDFWELVFASKTSTIMGKDVKMYYWPSEKTSVSYGDNLTIENKSERSYGSHVVRTLAIHKGGDLAGGFYIKLYHFITYGGKWPNQWSVFDVLCQARDWRKSQTSSPTLFHCDDGDRFSSTVCALKCIMDSVESGRCADVDLARHYLEVDCPNLLYNKEQEELVEAVLKLYEQFRLERALI